MTLLTLEGFSLLILKDCSDDEPLEGGCVTIPRVVAFDAKFSRVCNLQRKSESSYLVSILYHYQTSAA